MLDVNNISKVNGKNLHLADAFIQSDLQYIQVINFLSVCWFLGI